MANVGPDPITSTLGKGANRTDIFFSPFETWGLVILSTTRLSYVDVDVLLTVLVTFEAGWGEPEGKNRNSGYLEN